MTDWKQHLDEVMVVLEVVVIEGTDVVESATILIGRMLIAIEAHDERPWSWGCGALCLAVCDIVVDSLLSVRVLVWDIARLIIGLAHIEGHG